MISAKEIHELRFEKAAFGYKQEDIDEFLTQLEPVSYTHLTLPTSDLV